MTQTFGHFVAQKVPKCSKPLKTAFGGRFKVFLATIRSFRDFDNFCRFWLIFYLERDLLKG
jgi:hypothetical protein